MRVFCLLLLLWGCGEDLGGSRIIDQNQSEQAPPTAIAPHIFSTRLSRNLLVSGEICQGDETIILNTETYTCHAKQYLLRLDNVNTCESSGVCSTFIVQPIIVDLVNINARGQQFEIYEFDPAVPVTNEQERILEGIALRSDLQGNSTVIFTRGQL